VTIPAQPLVSIIIPVYNAGEYLRPAVESIICQTYQNMEMIIVDDGSTDHCFETLSNIRDSRIKFIRQSNSGKSVALNNALRIIKGRYYAIQDADDIGCPGRIEKLAAAMEEEKELAAVFSGYDLLINSKHQAPRFFSKNQDQCRADIDCFHMPSHDPTGMYRISLVKDIQYDPTLRIGQGYDYILRVGELFPMKVIEECLYSYRIHFDSNTRHSSLKRNEMLKQVWFKAAKRRKLGLSAMARMEFSMHDGPDHSLTAHFMESVLDMRRKGEYWEAFRTGLAAIALNGVSLRYYKPIFYFFLPLKIIALYRNIKKKISRRRVWTN
jgi:glycosyltransferase involved in cell wall biosynthesis